MAELDRATLIKRELFLRVLTPTKPPAAVARRLVQMMVERNFRRGEVLYERGQPSDSAFFIVEGVVELQSRTEPPWTFDAGSVVGVLDSNIGRPRSRTAVALNDVKALEAPMDEWRDTLEDSPGFANGARYEIGKTLHELIGSLAPDGGFAPLAPLEEDDSYSHVAGTVVDRLVALRRCLHFEQASVQTLAELATRGEVVVAKRGETVLRPGSRDTVLVVVAGIASVERRISPVVEASFGPGKVVLGGGSFGGGLAEYAVMATTDCVLHRLSRADLDAMVEDHGELSLSIIRGMAIERVEIMRLLGQRKDSSLLPELERHPGSLAAPAARRFGTSTPVA